MTKEQLTKIAPNLKLEYDVVKTLLDKYEINSNQRVAGLFSQLGHESGDFKHKTENLNYSAQGLRKIFPKYFKDDASAEAYARKPEKIANRVYGNRMGNGDEASGEGWKFRGRGFIQLTGKQNYTAFAQSVNMPINEAIKYLESDEGALESALFYWKRANCNKYCDTEDIKGLTKSINGGFHGLEDRQSRYSKYKAILLA